VQALEWKERKDMYESDSVILLHQISELQESIEKLYRVFQSKNPTIASLRLPTPNWIDLSGVAAKIK
jgi:hypothetical protein